VAPQLEAKRFVVRGRVQGVGFRWFVQREAQALGVSGWVRNNFDGAVEALAVGSSAQLTALEAKLQAGPRAARVDSVEGFATEPPNDARTGFRIEGAW
jgi:acylphosphatase